MATTLGRNGRKIVGAGVLVLAISGGVAQAATVTTTGAKAWNSGRHLAVQDTLDDGSNAFANWNNSGNNRIETSGGKGATNDVTPSTLSNFRACRDISGGPDNCSSWVSP